MNENIERGAERKYTRTEGKKGTAIDYVIVDDRVWGCQKTRGRGFHRLRSLSLNTFCAVSAVGG